MLDKLCFLGGNGGGETNGKVLFDVDDDGNGLGGGSGGSPAMHTFPGSFFILSDAEVGLGTAEDNEPDFVEIVECVLCGGRSGGDRLGTSSLKDVSNVNCFPIRPDAFGNVVGLELDSAIVICFKIFGDAAFLPNLGELVAGGRINGTCGLFPGIVHEDSVILGGGGGL